MQLGKINIEIISDGYFGLDAGAMFGVVPKTIWGKSVANGVDNKNRLLMGLNCLLIQNGREKILIDTGIGTKFNDKYREIYAIDHQWDNLLKSLEPFCAPEEINHVIFTHLHFDHMGGSTYRDKEGNLALTFPNASYVIQRSEWERALDPDDKSRASYIEADIRALAESGRVTLVEGDRRFNENIELIHTAGHSPGHQVVKISSAGKTALYGGDLFPTSHHINPHYLPAYDLDPVRTIEFKKKLLERAEKGKWLFIWEHNPRRAVSRVVMEKGKYKLRPLL